MYFIRISILDKRLLQITDETKALIEGIRIKEWTKNERDFKTMSRAVKQGKRMCWSEMFFNSTYSMVSEYCAGCGNHKNIVEADPNRFELVKKVPAPIRRFSIELNNIFAGSHEAVLFADSDNTELIGRVINRGFSNVIINDDDQSSYFNLLNSISEWTDVNLFGMNEFIRLAEHGDYYYFAGDAIVLYGNTDQDIYKKLRRLRKTLASGVIRLLHVFKEDVFCKEVSKSVSSVIDGPDRVERFIRVWGDASDLEYENNGIKYLGGLPIGFYEDLGIPIFTGRKGDKSKYQKNIAKPTKRNDNDITDNHINTPSTTRVDPEMADFLLGQRTLQIWIDGGELNVGATTKDVVNITKARDEINKKFLISAINWQIEGVALDNLNRVKSTKDFIGLL